ncbi:EAL domain-containing protein [Acidicapsa ligni]|uniref:EAL domain-containing protein n=1 Tax=Acidicapsa ligni TaxID=542300 RepID=UPI0021DFF347|nr:EAL domain-containing protein [Acidicapsa ligni]
MKRRRRLAIAVLALLGTLLGAASGYWLGRASLMRTAGSGLASYAGGLVVHAEEYSRELSGIQKAFNPSPFQFCSPDEIAKMQALTYESLQVKEIGRTRNGKLECSAFLGRLNPPWQERAPSLVLGQGVNIYANVPLQIAGLAVGTIVEGGGVSAVLSPTAFDHWNRPGMRYMVEIVDRKSHQAVQIAGDKLDTDLGWVLSERSTRGPGMAPTEIYRARCSHVSPVCVVTASSTAMLIEDGKAVLWEYTALGSIAGFGLCLAIGQFYLRSMGTAQQLRRAIRREKLSLVYQPVIELPSRHCSGAEALVRWSDEDGVAAAPDFFVHLAEELGFIGELTAFVVRRAIAEVGEILRKNPELTLSINIAASDLEGDALFLLLDEQVKQARIAPGQIALELTERSTTDMDSLRCAIQRLHEYGYQVHIDDFGSGFSSLAYLHELAVDAIKIDRIFTRTIGTDAITASILPQILALAETLQLDVIVEGVETEAQAEYLIQMGRTMQVQGWLFGKPTVATELPKYKGLFQAETVL